MTVPVLPSLDTSIIPPFHFSPSPVHSNGFSFYIFPGFLAIIILLLSNNNNTLPDFPSISSQASLLFLSCCHPITTMLYESWISFWNLWLRKYMEKTSYLLPLLIIIQNIRIHMFILIVNSDLEKAAVIFQTVWSPPPVINPPSIGSNWNSFPFHYHSSPKSDFPNSSWVRRYKPPPVCFASTSTGLKSHYRSAGIVHVEITDKSVNTSYWFHLI